MACNTPSFNPVPWDEMLPMVQISAHSAPLNVVEHCLRQAANEFLSKTLALEVDVYVDLQAGVQDYSVQPPDGYRIQQIRQVLVDGVNMGGLSSPPGGHAGSTNHTHMPCRSFWFVPPTSILVAFEGTCDSPGGMLVRAAIAPTQDSCFIDRDIYERYGEVISEGALSRILIMPNTAWYNPPSAGIMLRRFQFGVNRAKNDKGREFSGPKFMRAPRFI
jgi:hypothetical protein